MTKTRFTPYNDVDEVLRALLDKVKAILGESFIGLYLYGSLATGDFDPQSSDIDFAVVTKNILPDEIIARLESMHNEIWAAPIKWAAKLEGSYIPKDLIRRHDPNGAPCPTVNEGKFFLDRRGSDWIIQRHVIRECGVVIAGPDPKTLIDPISSDEICQAVFGVLNEWWFPMLENPAWLKERGSEYHAYTVISLCRALHAIKYGIIVSKPAAVNWAREEFPEWSPLIRKAKIAQPNPQEEFLMETLEFMQFTKGIISTLKRAIN